MKNRVAPPVSFLYHAHALFDNPPSTERELEIYIANNTPGPSEINIDRAMKLGLFLYEYCGVIDLALQDSQAAPKAQDMLATCLDMLAYEYVTDKDTSRSLRLLKGLINRFYRSTSLPLVFVWQKLCCKFFGGVPAIIPGVTEAQVMAAMSRRYEKYNKGAGFENPPISQPEYENGEEDMSKIEDMLKDLKDCMVNFGSRLDSIEKNQAQAAVIQPAAAATTPQAPTAVTAAAPQAPTTVVTPISVCPPKDRATIEREKYQAAVEEFRKEFFDDKFDLAGAIEKLQASVGSIDLDKFTKTAVARYCKENDKADMQQVFRLIYHVESDPVGVTKAIKEIMTAGLAGDMKDAVIGYVNKDRVTAFNKSESLRNHENSAIKNIGQILMGW